MTAPGLGWRTMISAATIRCLAFDQSRLAARVRSGNYPESWARRLITAIVKKEAQ